VCMKCFMLVLMRLFFAYAGRQHMISCSKRAVAYIVKACVYELLNAKIIEIVFCTSLQAAHELMQHESGCLHC
jgi:hypothetical protein